LSVLPQITAMMPDPRARSAKVEAGFASDRALILNKGA
jgi:hypothetical protein